MIREGEAGPTAPYSWRLRLPLGLFALAVLGASLHVGGLLGEAVLVPAGELLAQARGLSPLWTSLVAGLALLTRAALRRCSEPREQPRARPALPGLELERRARLPGPGPARELLALFASPRPAQGARAAAACPPAGETSRTEPVRAAEATRREQERPMLCLYGPLSVERGERRGLRDRSARGLLACLALRRGPVGFAELVELLWPGEDPAKARTRLYKAKQLARGALGEGLERQGAAYALDLTRVSIDVLELERMGAAGAGLDALERAFALSRSAPLADVDYPFAESERRRLGSIRIDLLARVARARLDAGRPQSALDAAEELIALDALNELGWRLAMESEAALGARRAIIERYRLLCAELDGALGLRPQAETRATYRRLLGQA